MSKATYSYVSSCMSLEDGIQIAQTTFQMEEGMDIFKSECGQNTMTWVEQEDANIPRRHLTQWSRTEVTLRCTACIN